MRSVRADGELELEKKFVRGSILAVMGASELPADLAELARPISKYERSARVLQHGQRGQQGIQRRDEAIRRILQTVVDPLRAVESASQEPASRELIVARNVETEGRYRGHRLLDTAPDDLAASNKRVINRAPQRFPTNGGVHSVDFVDHVRSDGRVPARIGAANIEIGGFGDVAISTQMLHR